MTKFRAVSWDETLWVAIYPINVDNDAQVEKYINGLSNRNFATIERFFTREAASYALAQRQPFKVLLAHTVHDVPPRPPEAGNIFSIGWWSLKLRYWAYTRDESDFSPHIKIFALYHSYDKDELEHSLGMEKGMIGVVHAYAHREMEGKNNLVIAHEALHTIGATDKYNLETGQPLYPDGFVEPDRLPLYPQRFTEIMGARMPVSKLKSVMPRSLFSVRVGEITAQEIRWRTQ